MREIHVPGPGMLALKRVPLLLLVASLVACGEAATTGPSERPLRHPVLPSTVGCGGKVTASMVLQADIGPCSAGGLTIGSSNITLDLNGHRIFGTGSPVNGVGITVAGRRGVVIKNGTVEDFDQGILFTRRGKSTQGTRLSRIENMVILDSARSGIFLEWHSDDNTLEGNTIEGSGGVGPVVAAGVGLVLGRNNTIANNTIRNTFGSGVLLGSASAPNTITMNTIQDNNGPGISQFGNGPDNQISHNLIDSNLVNGINTDFFSDRTSIQHNTITNNGGHGISTLSSDNLVSNNTIDGNGLDGVVIFGGTLTDPNTGNIVRNNVIQNNGRTGVFVRCTIDLPTPQRDCTTFTQTNQVLDNVVTGNGGANAGTQIFQDGFLVGNFDLLDTNPNNDCDSNTWSGNLFDAAFPTCTME